MGLGLGHASLCIQDSYGIHCVENIAFATVTTFLTVRYLRCRVLHSCWFEEQDMVVSMKALEWSERESPVHGLVPSLDESPMDLRKRLLSVCWTFGVEV